jgi:hypothetical protein
MSRRAVYAVAAVFALCSLGLAILHQQMKVHYRLPAHSAIAAARANGGDRQFLAHNPTTGVRVIPLDSRLQRVTFFDGPQVVLDAAVGEHGEVLATEQHVAGAPASGAVLANSPWILGLLSAVFLLAVAVTPLWRIRNLDALVLASLTLTVPLINARLAGASVICADLALAYLLLRCAAIGLHTAADAPPPPSTPLLDRLCAGWSRRRRVRLLRLLLLATVLAFAMITLTSSGYTDVAVASLEGATELLHGTLPYGHIQLALHGDTYPLLNYLLYLPGALLDPVSTAFSDLSGSLAVTAAASLLAGLALYRIAASPQMGGDADEQRSERGLRATLAWFAFPPVLLAASGGANDVLLAACLAWMLALRHRRGSSLLMLAFGVWVKLVPVILLALWPGQPQAQGSRGSRARAWAPAFGLSLALTALLLALGGPGAISAMISAISFQFARGSFFAPWYTFDLQWLQPLAQAAVIALAFAAVLRVRASGGVRLDLVRVSAIAAALLLGVQLAANYWTWSYLVWVLPFLLPALLIADADAGAAPGTAPSAGAHVEARPPERRARPGRRRSPSAVGSAR